MKGPQRMAGYKSNPEATSAVVDKVSQIHKQPRMEIAGPGLLPMQKILLCLEWKIISALLLYRMGT
jgi:hypothetical protein